MVFSPACQARRYMWLSAFRSGVGEEEVQRLRLVDPLLAARGGVDQPRAARSGRRCGSARADPAGIRSISRQVAVEVLQLARPCSRIPEAARLEVAHEERVEHDEVAGEVRLREQVLVDRLDAGRRAHDVRDRRGRRDREHVRVAHALRARSSRAAAPSPAGRRAALRPARRAPARAGRACPAAAGRGPTSSPRSDE